MIVRKNERPTLPPAGELAQAPQAPRSETRLSTRPSAGAVMTDEAWARSMTGAPIAVVPVAELVRLPLDHRAGFLLSRMDGFIDLDTLVEISAMRRADALKLVRELCDSGIVEFH